jgi:hypothetical protein
LSFDVLELHLLEYPPGLHERCRQPQVLCMRYADHPVLEVDAVIDRTGIFSDGLTHPVFVNRLSRLIIHQETRLARQNGFVGLAAVRQ